MELFSKNVVAEKGFERLHHPADSCRPGSKIADSENVFMAEIV